MATIQLLDQNTINQIAAGEVVERPASVVKELVENAIDAGAKAVTVEVKDGGLKLIRITDNGSGIEKGQIPTAFLRHSTSKIREASDLSTIVSLGFRGEALASIAAVAMVEVITKTEGDTTGARYIIEGGEEKAFESIGCPTGTTFLIKDLFYNTPARLKFMKTPSTELGYVADLMSRLAMGNPTISFKFISNGKVRLQTSGKDNLKDCVYNVYGKDVARNLIAIKGSLPGMWVSGFIGKPHISRGNRTYENYFLNGRYIKSKVVEKAIEDAFKAKLMLHRYPFVAFHIHVESEDVDVNVHPTKMEVRFMKEKDVYDLIFRTLDSALNGRSMIPEVKLTDEKAEKRTYEPAPEPFESKADQRIEEVMGSYSHDKSKPSSGAGDTSGQSSPFKGQVPTIDLMKPKAAEALKAAMTLGKEKEEPVQHMKRQPAEGTKTEKADPDRAKSHSNEPRDTMVVTGEIKKDRTLIQKPVFAETRDGRVTNETVNKDLMREKSGDDSEEMTEVLPAQIQQDSSKLPGEETYKGDQISLEGEDFISPKSIKSHKVVGQLFDTYWIVELDEKYYIIDQHAAHEKVLYEEMMNKIDTKVAFGQRLLKPVVVNMTLQEMARYEEHKKLFADLGFEVEIFGEEAVLVRSVPFIFDRIFDVDQFTQILDGLDGAYTEDKYSILLHDVATMSCKAAVKGNDRLSPMEYMQLIEDLLKLEDPFHCPHGRPTIIAMTRHELEKKFKRIV